MWDSPIQFTIALMMISAAIAATLMRNRLASVILVGLTGYGCGVLFALHVRTRPRADPVPRRDTDTGDLRARAPEVPRRSRREQGDRLQVAACRTRRRRRYHRHPPSRPSRPMPETLVRSTNCFPTRPTTWATARTSSMSLLVDIRAWDTLGEISVLLVAANWRRQPRLPQPPGSVSRRASRNAPSVIVDKAAANSDTTWLRGGDLIDPRHRSLVLEVTTRLIFPTIMVLSNLLLLLRSQCPLVAVSPEA